MGLVSIVKAGASAIRKHTGKNDRTIDAQFVDLGKNSAGSQSNGIKMMSVHPEAAGLLQSYFGIDLSNIPNMTPEELGEMVDFLRQSEWMDQHLDVLKAHFKAYIARQLSFNQFCSEVAKDGINAAKSIDKAGLDTYLAVKGYTANTKKLGHKASLEEKYADKDLESYIDLENYSLEASFRAMAAKIQKQKRDIDDRPIRLEAQIEERATIKAEEDRIKNLIAYGTQPIGKFTNGKTQTVEATVIPNNSDGGKREKAHWSSTLKNFFNGK